MNESIFSGNLVRDPDVKSIGSGKVASFTVAVNRRYRAGNDWKEETAYVDFEAWDSLADMVVDNVKKGTGVIVKGTARTHSWEDKETKSKRSRLVYRLDEMGLLLRRPSSATAANKDASVANVEEEVLF